MGVYGDGLTGGAGLKWPLEELQFFITLFCRLMIWEKLNLNCINELTLKAPTQLSLSGMQVVTWKKGNRSDWRLMTGGD